MDRTEKTNLPWTYTFAARDYEVDSTIAGIEWWVEEDERGKYVAYKLVLKADSLE